MLLRLRAVLDHGPLAVEVVVMGVWLAPINTSSAAVAGLLECRTVHFSQPKLLLLRSSNVLFEPLQHSFRLTAANCSELQHANSTGARQAVALQVFVGLYVMHTRYVHTCQGFKHGKKVAPGAVPNGTAAENASEASWWLHVTVV